jgi:hypothetical protein
MIEVKLNHLFLVLEYANIARLRRCEILTG